MDMRDEWISALCQWAWDNDNVCELWLFGSRAKGGSTPESDVDLGLALMPPEGKHNWALGNYFAFESEWKAQLEAIVGRHVSLEYMDPGSEFDKEVRRIGVRLWSLRVNGNIRVGEVIGFGIAVGPIEEVHLGASTPRAVVPGETFVARFVAYTDATQGTIVSIIESEAPGSHTRLGLDRSRWRRDTVVTVRLEATNAHVANPVQTFKWDGFYKIVRFDVTVFDDVPADRLILRFDVAVEGLPIVALRPEIKVKRNRRGKKVGRTSLLRVPAPRSAFASYTNGDRAEVLSRVRSVQICTGMNVFLDCLSIRPGEEWKQTLQQEIQNRDIFWLFWSREAMKSPWVDWEWRTALAAKTITGIQPHPLEPSDLAPAPEELSDLQFGAVYEWYIAHLRQSRP
jgi:predicted nucleotidyltransferase